MISVVMASYLGDYPNSASSRVEKFHRAISGYVNQTFKETELIIVSDGCDKTNEIVENYYSGIKNIRLIKLDKQPMFSGSVRNAGIEHANGEWICYLDTDDVIGFNHLEIISNQIHDDYDWFYYDDYLNKRGDIRQRESAIALGRIGTSNIIHRKELNIEWRDGYNHDFVIVKALIRFKYKKLEIAPEYFVMHMPRITDE